MRPPRLGGPQDTPRDKRAARRHGHARLRVRTPGDAPATGRGVPVPGMQPGSPSHLAATLGQDPSNAAPPRRPAARGRSTKGDSGAGCGRIDLPHTAALAVWITRDLGRRARLTLSVVRPTVKGLRITFEMALTRTPRSAL